MQPWCTPFLILNQSIVPCPVLTVDYWPAYRERDYYEELAHVIMDTEKIMICHPPAEGPVKWCLNYLSLRVRESGAQILKGRRRWMSQLKQRKQFHPSSTFWFYSGPQQIEWCTWTGEGGSSLLSSSVQMLICPSQVHPEIMLSEHPWAQSIWHVKLAMTLYLPLASTCDVSYSPGHATLSLLSFRENALSSLNPVTALWPSPNLEKSF